MEYKTLGEIIKQLRHDAGFSIRELARRSEMSAPFLSDIELGRRFPSEDVLTRVAKVLKVPLQELQQYDTRESLSSLKKLMDQRPAWGFALRNVAEKAVQGKISPDDLMKIK